MKPYKIGSTQVHYLKALTKSYILNVCFSLEISHSKVKLATESAHVLTTTCSNLKVLNVYNLSFIYPI